jgi:predicted MFS family arabinose efflux permease
LLGTLGLAAVGRLRRQLGVILGGALLYGVALLVVAHTSIYVVGVALLVLAGVAYAVVNALLAARLQLVVPDRVRGRVMALQTIAYIPMDAIGSLITGGVAQVVGPATALTCGALVFLLALPFLARALAKFTVTTKENDC